MKVLAAATTILILSVPCCAQETQSYLRAQTTVEDKDIKLFGNKMETLPEISPHLVESPKKEEDMFSPSGEDLMEEEGPPLIKEEKDLLMEEEDLIKIKKEREHQLPPPPPLETHQEDLVPPPEEDLTWEEDDLQGEDPQWNMDPKDTDHEDLNTAADLPPDVDMEMDGEEARELHVKKARVGSRSNLMNAPDIDSLTFAFNMLSGVPPDEQIAYREMHRMFSFSNDFKDDRDTHTDRFNVPIEVVDIIDLDSKCVSKETSNSYFNSVSSASLSAQSESSSHGTDINAELGFEKGGASVSTNVRLASTYGNSKSSSESRSSYREGYKYSFSGFSETLDYRITMDWDEVNWNDDIKALAWEMSHSSGWEPYFTFIRKFGTHVIHRSWFGAKCKSTINMEGSRSQEDYQKTFSEASKKENAFLWSSTSEASSSEQAESFSEVTGMQYKQAGAECIGSYKAHVNAESCGFFQSSAGDDAPKLISWGLKPIWELDIGGALTSSGQQRLKDTYFWFEDVQQRASVHWCSGNGVMSFKNDIWKDLTIHPTYWEDFLDYSCFCDDGYYQTSDGRCSNAPTLSDSVHGAHIQNNENDCLLVWNWGHHLWVGCATNPWEPNTNDYFFWNYDAASKYLKTTRGRWEGMDGCLINDQGHEGRAMLWYCAGQWQYQWKFEDQHDGDGVGWITSSQPSGVKYCLTTHGCPQRVGEQVCIEPCRYSDPYMMWKWQAPI